MESGKADVFSDALFAEFDPDESPMSCGNITINDDDGGEIVQLKQESILTS